MKRRAIIFILTVLLLITAFSCKQKRNEEKIVVRDAVSYSNAIWKCLTQKDYYIAQRGDNNIKTDFWILFDGPFGKEIQLTGYNPEFEMTGRLIGFNKFLLKGHYADELGRMYIGGKERNSIPNGGTQKKGYWNYGNFYGHHAFDRDENGQLLHSRYYFDSLDIENGDYFPNGDSPLGRQDGLE